MRRWVLIFLLLVVPYQMVWAAAAPYCAHEKSVTFKHLGHHEHTHKSGDGQPGDDNGPSGAFHTDCGSCHVANPGWVAEMAQTVCPVAAAVHDYLKPHYNSCIVAGPERPQKSSAPLAVRFGSGVAPGTFPT